MASKLTVIINDYGVAIRESQYRDFVYTVSKLVCRAILFFKFK